MFTPKPIGVVKGPYTQTKDIPKGPGAKHDAVGTLETVVELLRREGRVLHVRGVDMLDGTPILDIKPYLSSVPENAQRRGWLAEAEARGKG